VFPPYNLSVPRTILYRTRLALTARCLFPTYSAVFQSIPVRSAYQLIAIVTASILKVPSIIRRPRRRRITFADADIVTKRAAQPVKDSHTRSTRRQKSTSKANKARRQNTVVKASKQPKKAPTRAHPISPHVRNDIANPPSTAIPEDPHPTARPRAKNTTKARSRSRPTVPTAPIAVKQTSTAVNLIQEVPESQLNGGEAIGLPLPALSPSPSPALSPLLVVKPPIKIKINFRGNSIFERPPNYLPIGRAPPLNITRIYHKTLKVEDLTQDKIHPF
jgi:hypothetical protein